MRAFDACPFGVEFEILAVFVVPTSAATWFGEWTDACRLSCDLS
jgi:hypothetical protein